MKLIKWTAAALVLGFVVLYFSLGFIVKKSFERIGPLVTKTEVKIGLVTLSPITGSAAMRKFRLGNPSGYNSPYAVTVGKFHMKMDPGSMMKKTIRVREIVIDQPEIYYEGNNLKEIERNVSNFLPPSKGKKTKPPQKVRIDRIRIQNGKIHWKVDLPLPDIELKDIGKEGDGVQISSAVSMVMKSMTKGVTSGVASLGSQVKDTTQGALKSVKKIFKR